MNPPASTNSMQPRFMNMMLMITITILIMFGPFHPPMVQCWLFSPRITPYYYPFPYPVPASILPGGSSSSSSSLSSVAPGSTGTGYIGQTSIGSTPDYNYNWYNYQSNPNSNVLFPSLSGATTTGSLGGIGSGITGNNGFGIGGATTGGLGTMMPVPESLLRSWWTRKFTKLGLRSPGSSIGGFPATAGGGGGMGMGGVLGLGGGLGLGGTSSLLGSSSNPCYGYWASGGVSGGGGGGGGVAGLGPCTSNSNLCCYPLVVQTTVDSTARPYHTDSVTYPSTGYLYQPQSNNHHGYKTSASTSGQQQQQYHHQTSLRPQASEQVDEIVAESSRSDVD